MMVSAGFSRKMCGTGVFSSRPISFHHVQYTNGDNQQLQAALIEVRSNAGGSTGFLGQPQRLCVLLTRARVGSQAMAAMGAEASASSPVARPKKMKTSKSRGEGWKMWKGFWGLEMFRRWNKLTQRKWTTKMDCSNWAWQRHLTELVIRLSETYCHILIRTLEVQQQTDGPLWQQKPTKHFQAQRAVFVNFLYLFVILVFSWSSS